MVPNSGSATCDRKLGFAILAAKHKRYALIHTKLEKCEIEHNSMYEDIREYKRYTLSMHYETRDERIL